MCECGNTLSLGIGLSLDEDVFGVNDLKGDEVIVETEVDHEVVIETEVASKDAKIDVDYQLAQRLQAQEQEELTDEEKSRLMEPKSLKNKSFANIQELFDKAFKKVNTFVDYRTEVMKESSKKAKVMEESSKKAKAEIAQESVQKRAGESLEQESSKKQKVEEDKESEELKHMFRK
ncbi:hypothetical protein Tco_0808250 [Tanacetum coccineum]